MPSIDYLPYEPQHFDAVIALGTEVHGDNYLDPAKAEYLYRQSLSAGINASLVALEGGELVGFRLTQAPGKWDVDEWCSPGQWQLPQSKVCYFKCNTVRENHRGLGIGGEMLRRSVAQSKQQGAEAGIAHIWLASPGNSAFGYFSAAGATLVREHPNKWQSLSINDGYDCPVCDDLCHCTAAEMILRF